MHMQSMINCILRFVAGADYRNKIKHTAMEITAIAVTLTELGGFHSHEQE